MEHPRHQRRGLGSEHRAGSVLQGRLWCLGFAVSWLVWRGIECPGCSLAAVAKLVSAVSEDGQLWMKACQTADVAGVPWALDLASVQG